MTRKQSEFYSTEIWMAYPDIKHYIKGEQLTDYIADGDFDFDVNYRNLDDIATSILKDLSEECRFYAHESFCDR